MRDKIHKARPKGDYQLDIVTLRYGKGILTLADDREATTKGMAVSHKWVSYFRGAYLP